MGSFNENLPITNVHGTFAKIAPRLFDCGYTPLPLDGKRPIKTNWNKQGYYSDKYVEQLTHQYPHANVGILTGELITIDIDIMDKKKSQEVAALTMKIMGPTDFIRIGQAPKRALLYRTNSPSKKRRIGDVEILGVGQQVAVFGKHPKTHQPYQWPLESILDCPIDQLPTISKHELDLFSAEVAAYQNIKPTMSVANKDRYEGRNSSYFNYLKNAAMGIDTFDALKKQGEEYLSDFVEPLPIREVNDTTKSVWKYKLEGRLFVTGKQQIVLPFGKDRIIEYASQPRALVLYALLLSTRSKASFTIPQTATAKLLGWGTGTIRNAISYLIDNRLIEIVEIDTRCIGWKKPTMYRFSLATNKPV